MRVVEERFVCEHCGKDWDSEKAYDKCVLSHDIVYIGLERTEWKELIRDITWAFLSGAYFNEKVLEKLRKYKVG